MKKTLKALCALAMCASLVGCSSGSSSKTAADSYEAGTELRIAAGYQKTNEAISFQDADIVGDGLTLADGVTYHTGDLKPTWVAVSETLEIEFTNKFSGAGSADKEYAYWENQLDQVDIIAGGAASLNAAGAEGKLVNIADYLDVMPNFKAYLDENPIVRLSITGNTETGAIYFSPYFDGVDDIERMPLIRADLVRELLDDETATFDADRAVTTGYYEPYMPTSGKVEVESLTADGTATQTITKDYDAYGNIIEKMNTAGSLTGKEALQMLKDYIDATYVGVYENRSDLFLGYDAAWDADELVALMRCAAALYNDTDGNAMVPLYSRETSNLQREVDIYRFAGILFGVRGLESRNETLYFDSEGVLQDAREQESTYEAIERIQNLVKEGLVQFEGSGTSTDYLTKNAGLVSYDYNQTQTLITQSKGLDAEYIAIMVPVAQWDDGTGASYFRFTESWRSVKTDGWAISLAGVEDDDNKLYAALALIDYAFSVQGQITLSYSSDAFIKVKDASVEVTTWDDVAKKYETFDFNGKQMPVVSDETYAECTKLTGGNYTNYARRYLGSCLNGYPKQQSFEYQLTTENGKKGAAVLSAAISAGVIKHPYLEVYTDNMWYTSVPTTLPTTAEQTSTINNYTELKNNFSTSKGGVSVLYDLMKTGTSDLLSGCSDMTASGIASYIASSWNDDAYLKIRNAQWTNLLEFYNNNK